MLLFWGKGVRFSVFGISEESLVVITFEKKTKWPTGISQEPFDALRSVMARFFAFFTLFHLSLPFFRPEVPFNERYT